MPTGVLRLRKLMIDIQLELVKISKVGRIALVAMEAYTPNEKFGQHASGEVGGVIKLTVLTHFGARGERGFPVIVAPQQLKKFASGEWQHQEGDDRQGSGSSAGTPTSMTPTWPKPLCTRPHRPRHRCQSRDASLPARGGQETGGSHRVPTRTETQTDPSRADQAPCSPRPFVSTVGGPPSGLGGQGHRSTPT